MRDPLIQLENVSFRYPNSDLQILRSVSLSIGEGEFVLVAGPSGAGKSTLLRTLNGLVPHFTGGQISGQIRVVGHDPVAQSPHGMSPVVGLVQQDPEAQLCTLNVMDEIAFGPENFLMSKEEINEKVEWALEVVGAKHLVGRETTNLSGGEFLRMNISIEYTPSAAILSP